MRAKTSVTVRRSVALPQELVEEVQAVAPRELQSNWNRLVMVALEEFAARQKAHAFDKAMAQMAADAQLQEESQAIMEEFREAEEDGLTHGAAR